MTTPLLDGSVLFAGGYTDDYGEAASSQTAVYDPASRNIAPKPNLAWARDYHTATLLKDGRVLIAGGYNGDGILSTAELYDPATGTFSQPGNMSMYRDGHAATLLRDGRVLITGGRASVSSWPPDPNDSSAELFIPESSKGDTPRLTLDWTQYCTSDYWGLTADGLPPLAPVQISGFRDGTPWTIPGWKTSGKDGRLDVRGGYAADAAGDYTIWLYAGGKASNSVSISVEPCSVQLEMTKTNSGKGESYFLIGDSWTLHVTSSMPGANVKLFGISNGTRWTIESWGRTGSDGSFTVTGAFPPDSIGSHALRVTVGSAQSNQVGFLVDN
jgi:hypothetical protein